MDRRGNIRGGLFANSTHCFVTKCMINANIPVNGFNVMTH